MVRIIDNIRDSSVCPYFALLHVKGTKTGADGTVPNFGIIGNMRNITLFYAISACSAIFFSIAVPAAQAITHSKVSGGSKYYCGYLPNGSTKLFVKQGHSFEVTSVASASKAAVRNRNSLQKRANTIDQLIEAVHNDNDFFNKHDNAEYLKIFLFWAKGKSVKLPRSSAEKITRLQTLKSKVLILISNAQAEIDGINGCKDFDQNKPHEPLTLDTDVQHVNDQGFDYVILLLFVPDFGGSSANYCVRRSSAPVGTSNLQEFSRKPCLHFNCPTSLVPSGQLADIIYTSDLGFGATDDEISAAINELSAMAASGYLGVKSTDCSIL